MCYYHTCKKEYHPLGIARHHAMHRDRRENCMMTFSGVDTYTFSYAKKS